MDNTNNTNQPSEHTHGDGKICGNCAHRGMWMNHSLLRVFVALVVLVFVFSAGMAVGRFHSGGRFGYNRHFGRFNGGPGMMMRGYGNWQPAQGDINSYPVPNGMMRVRGATNTPTNGVPDGK